MLFDFCVWIFCNIHIFLYILFAIGSFLIQLHLFDYQYLLKREVCTLFMKCCWIWRKISSLSYSVVSEWLILFKNPKKVCHHGSVTISVDSLGGPSPFSKSRVRLSLHHQFILLPLWSCRSFEIASYAARDNKKTLFGVVAVSAGGFAHWRCRGFGGTEPTSAALA